MPRRGRLVNKNSGLDPAELHADGRRVGRNRASESADFRVMQVWRTGIGRAFGLTPSLTVQGPPEVLASPSTSSVDSDLNYLRRDARRGEDEPVVRAGPGAEGQPSGWTCGRSMTGSAEGC